MSPCKTDQTCPAGLPRWPRTARSLGAATIPVLILVIVIFAVGSAAIVTGIGHGERIRLNQKSIEAGNVVDFDSFLASYLQLPENP